MLNFQTSLNGLPALRCCGRDLAWLAASLQFQVSFCPLLSSSLPYPPPISESVFRDSHPTKPQPSPRHECQDLTEQTQSFKHRIPFHLSIDVIPGQISSLSNVFYIFRMTGGCSFIFRARTLLGRGWMSMIHSSS